MSGTTRPGHHAATADAQWRALAVQPDLCRVGKDVIGFASQASLDKPESRSPDVYGDALPIYRQGDWFQGIQGDAGQHIVSGTSGGTGYVRILSGNESVRVNGQPIAVHGSRCLINCNADGVGGALGQLVTEVKPPPPKRPEPASKPEPRPMDQRMGDEALKVLKDTAQSLKQTASTLWEALPFTSDPAITAAARERITQGFGQAAQGFGALFGAQGEFINAAYMSGNPQAIAAAEQLIAQQQQATTALADSVGQSWRDASARSGTAGAVAMVGTSFFTELLGGKGLGALTRVASRIAEIGKLAKTPMEAARLLDQELKAARAAGKSAQEIKMLEEARSHQLVEARKAQQAKVEGQRGEGDGPGVYIQAKRIPCFHPFDKKKFQAMKPEQKKAYLKEMAEQLKRQQDQINSMSAIEFKAARDAFANNHGRNPLAATAQEGFRKGFANDVAESIKESLKNGGMDAAAAKAEAAARTKDVMSKLAALHEPDMVAGGWLQPNPTAMGRADVNSSIGSSWNQEGRVKAMEGSAEDAINAGNGSQKMNVQLEVCRGRGLR
jgi:uncharacterized Zn-binding protein involved in type VI secretion